MKLEMPVHLVQLMTFKTLKKDLGDDQHQRYTEQFILSFGIILMSVLYTSKHN